MKADLCLLCILAHPDDESLGTGGILARYSAEGIATCLVTATRGEHGWTGPAGEYPGPGELGRMREQELRCAAGTLGVDELVFLDYIDGQLDQADPSKITAELVDVIRRIRPQVVVTFDANGYYGHPDHIAISQFTGAAVLAAADPGCGTAAAQPPHRVDKLYWIAPDRHETQIFQAAFGEIAMPVRGLVRRPVPWQDWAITTVVDTRAYWRQVWQAISCHCTQLPSYQSLVELPAERHEELWGRQTFYRSFSLVNGGPQPETDLFAGLR